MNLTLAGGEGELLLAGLGSTGGEEPASLFAVRADLAGRIVDSRLLSRLNPEDELLSLRTVRSAGGYGVVALIVQPAEGDTIRFWFLSDDGTLKAGVAAAKQLFPDGDVEIALSDLHLLSFRGERFIIYRVDVFDPDAAQRSALMMKRLYEGSGAMPVVLKSFEELSNWEVTAAASADNHFALILSTKSTIGYLGTLWVIDAESNRLAEPVPLYDAKNLFQAELVWEGDADRWVIMRGTPLRYWFQAIYLRDGRLERAAEEPLEIRFGASLASFNRAASGYKAVLLESKRLLSAFLDSDGFVSGSPRELVGRGETGNRVLHLLASAWIGERLAAILFFGNSTVFRILEP